MPAVSKYLLLLFSFLGFHLSAQVSCSVTAYGDTTLCSDGTVQLNASPGFDYYTWSPPIGLSNPNIANPVATVTGSMTYVLTASTSGTNIIPNGDFSLGNVGFTSGQIYSSTYSPCNYYVDDAYFTIASYGFIDHTPSADNMFMSIDGCYTAPTVIYETTVPVTSFTSYNFSFWATRAGAVEPDFEVHFIGNVTGDVIMSTTAGIPYTGVMTWDEYGATTWNSGGNTSLTIRIVNLEIDGYGNDFGLDDVNLSANACTATDTVVITNMGMNVTVSGDLDLCQGESTTLTASGGTSFLWNTGETTPSITVSPAISSSYEVIGDNGTGCQDTVQVHITVAPIPIIVLTGDDSLCLGETSTLVASGGLNYLWNTGATTSSINVTPGISSTYTVIVTNATNCKDTASHTINVSPVPLPPVMTNDTTVCVGVILPILQAAGQNIAWYGSAGSTSGSSTAPYPYTDAAGTYAYFATQTVDGCESNKAQTTVEVVALPFFDLPGQLNLCEGDTMMIGAPLNNGWQYQWRDSLTVNSRPTDHSGLYVLTTTNVCASHTDSCEVTIDFCDCFLYLPNAFTPNSDDINDVFKPVYDCRFETYQLRIFDRWGEIVFESQDPQEAWDGRYKNRLSQQDVYVVLVQYTGKAGLNLVTKEYRGHVTVLR